MSALLQLLLGVLLGVSVFCIFWIAQDHMKRCNTLLFTAFSIIVFTVPYLAYYSGFGFGEIAFKNILIISSFEIAVLFAALIATRFTFMEFNLEQKWYYPILISFAVLFTAVISYCAHSGLLLAIAQAAKNGVIT